MKKIIVVGGGAAGLMAAYAAASTGKQVILLEKNEKLGKKIYITGKGRCNLTNDCSPDDFLNNLVRGAKFMTRTAYVFPPSKTMEFFESNGLPLKVERGNRVFPVSDHASDVTKTLERACRNAGVQICLGTCVTGLKVNDGAVCGVLTDDGERPCDAVIIATGGLSYPSTGSTGDGYRFALAAGHTVVPTVPSLVGNRACGKCLGGTGNFGQKCRTQRKMQGKHIFSQMGELLFTHYGISGPLVLSLSALINRLDLSDVRLALDFKPALDEKAMEDRLLRDFSARKNEQMKNVMRGLLPAGLTQVVSPCRKSVGGKTGKCGDAGRAQAASFRAERAFFDADSAPRLCGGGHHVRRGRYKGDQSATMESRRVKGLYFCGEVLDCDAFTGGFNLQIAFSTGYMAGINT